ncbi:MAG: hypothetical protein ACR2O6_08330 [Ilumatobacteraceae bacterium]
MERLCERPGCSDPASVAYGMRPADLVFWLDLVNHVDGASHGVLCRRHADSMVVPRNWTLDDMRDPDLHLFRPPAPTADAPASRRRPTARSGSEQLELGIDGSAPEAPADEVEVEVEMAEPVVAAGGDAADEDPAETWTPSFDVDDDLDGLLAARSPLLARAFGGADRPRPRP